MPASAGRTRMPHNNRVSIDASLKTSSIWSKTIGHDPHAGKDDFALDQSQIEAQKIKAKEVLAVAKQQNLTDCAQRDDFALRMYRGLKEGKKRKAASDTSALLGNPQQQTLHEETSSSEEEFTRVKVKKKKDKKRKRRRARAHGTGSNSDDESDSDSSEPRRKRNKKKKKVYRRYSSDDDSSEDSREHNRRKQRKYKEQSKRKKQRRRNTSEAESRRFDSSDGEKVSCKASKKMEKVAAEENFPFPNV